VNRERPHLLAQFRKNGRFFPGEQDTFLSGQR
jgi:hypothetical protein